jgi:hypothetical protein
MAKEEKNSPMGMSLRVFLGMESLRVKAGMSGIMGPSSKECSSEVFGQVKAFFKPLTALPTLEISNRKVQRGVVKS